MSPAAHPSYDLTAKIVTRWDSLVPALTHPRKLSLSSWDHQWIRRKKNTHLLNANEAKTVAHRSSLVKTELLIIFMLSWKWYLIIKTAEFVSDTVSAKLRMSNTSVKTVALFSCRMLSVSDSLPSELVKLTCLNNFVPNSKRVSLIT